MFFFFCFVFLICERQVNVLGIVTHLGPVDYSAITRCQFQKGYVMSFNITIFYRNSLFNANSVDLDQTLFGDAINKLKY